MKVLVLGSGGREHALAWRIGNDPQVAQVFLHPGNAGTWRAGIQTLGDIPIGNSAALSTACHRLGIGLVVIGPEVLLAQGYADFFREEGFRVVGPGKLGAQLETSKAFAKRFLQDGGIPTAAYQVATTPEGVRGAISKYPVVLKLDGLAAGKGVVVAQEPSEAENFIARVWAHREFGEGPYTIVVEDFIAGKELSYIGLCDGKTFHALSTASDYKRVSDGDRGPNTGGMGAISPSPVASPELEAKIQATVVTPTLKQLERQGLEYRGALYFGLMVDAQGNPFVLEFNTRFGDPETQALCMRLQGDFTEYLVATADGALSTLPPPKWRDETAIYVVAAAQGYPSTPRAGDAIEGLESVPEDVRVFFSGVGGGSHGLVTQGGRVLGVGALGDSADASRRKAYETLDTIQWNGIHYRRDIGL